MAECLVDQTHHFDRSSLDEDGLRDVRFGEGDSLPCEGLEDAPVVQIVIVWVRVDVGQGRAVELCIG